MKATVMLLLLQRVERFQKSLHNFLCNRLEVVLPLLSRTYFDFFLSHYMEFLGRQMVAKVLGCTDFLNWSLPEQYKRKFTLLLGHWLTVSGIHCLNCLKPTIWACSLRLGQVQGLWQRAGSSASLSGAICWSKGYLCGLIFWIKVSYHDKT